MAKTSKVTKEEEKSLPPSIFGERMDELDEDDIDEIVEQPEFDLFEDVGAKLAASGDTVTYTLKKNGTFLEGALQHPQSWDKIRRKHGGGTFQAICRSQKKGGYVKSQARNLAEVEEDEPKEVSSTPSGSSPTEIFMLMQQMKRDEREENQRALDRAEAERQAREEKLERDAEKREQESLAREERRLKDEERKANESMSSNNMMMTMMFKMMEAQSANSTAIMTALLTAPKPVKEDLSIQKVMEMMDARMEKTISILTGAKGKNGEMSVAEQIKMNLDAEERGYRKARDIQKIAEDKAEELAELRERGTLKEGPVEPSTTKMLIESLVPAVQALVASRMGGMEPAPGTVPALPAPAKPALPPTAPALPAPAPKIIAPLQSRTVVGAIGSSFTPKVVPNPTLGPKIVQKPAVTTPQAIKLPIEPIMTSVKTAPNLNGSEKMSKSELIEKTIIAEIGKDLAKNLITGKFQPEKTADISLELLKPYGIDHNYLSSQFTLNDMIRIAKANKMPDAIRPYLERFHAHVTAVAQPAGETAVANTKDETTVGAGSTAPNPQPNHS